MNRIYKFGAILIFLALFSFRAQAQENEIKIHFFYSTTCPHCKEERKFLENLRIDSINVVVMAYEVSENRDNFKLLQKVGEELQADISGVPFTVIGDKSFSGYYSATTHGTIIRRNVKEVADYQIEDVVSKIIQQNSDLKLSVDDISLSHKDPSDDKPADVQRPNEEDEFLFDMPIVGVVDLRTLSLPVLTFSLALLDGFNPCAMWVLVFLISLLLLVEDKKRRWVLGITFIFASGLVYFLFLAAWLNAFLLIGYAVIVRTITGFLALGVGSYFLYDYWKNKRGGCKVMDTEKRKKTMQRMEKIIHTENILLAMGGMALLAVAVNVIELICSLGLPAIYTQVLALTPMPTLKYYSYLGFYILIFMLDDILVFTGAMLTMHSVGIESKYARYSHLFGGIILFLLGATLLLKPEILMFS